MMRSFLLCLALLLIGGRESLADSLKVEGKRYDYLVYAAAQPSVIIIAFHGFTGDGAVMAEQSKLHERGAAAVVAYPSGWWKTWDGTPDSIDVRMAAELIDILHQQYGPLPVCVTGISAGATMAWRVAAELPINALVAVAGPLNPVVGSPPGRPRVLELQGDADTMVPLEGGSGMFGEIPPAQAGIDLFRAAGSQAELRVIPGGQHLWDLGVGYDTTGVVLKFCGAKTANSSTAAVPPAEATVPPAEASAPPAEASAPKTQAIALPAGSYANSCRGVRVARAAEPNAVIAAECKNRRGQWIKSSLEYKRCEGDIANDDGRLVCGSKPPGAEITLYEKKGFGGRAMTFNGPVPDLGAYGFNGIVSSLRAAQAWYVCTKPRFKGKCTKTIGDVNLTPAWNDRIASLRPAD